MAEPWIKRENSLEQPLSSILGKSRGATATLFEASPAHHKRDDGSARARPKQLSRPISRRAKGRGGGHTSSGECGLLKATDGLTSRCCEAPSSCACSMCLTLFMGGSFASLVQLDPQTPLQTVATRMDPLGKVSVVLMRINESVLRGISRSLYSPPGW